MAKASTGALFAKVSGRLGDTIVVQLPQGTTLRRPPKYRKVLSEGQRAAATRLSQASAAWNTLTAEQAEAWRAYAEEQVRHNALTGERYVPTAISVFTALSTKFLMVQPEANVPLAPPESLFIPGTGQVLISASTGGIVFSPISPDTPGQVTELLIQSLRSPRCKPGQQYRSAGFTAFGGPAFVALAPGSYACAIRRVEIASGRTGLIMPLGAVTVN